MKLMQITSASLVLLAAGLGMNTAAYADGETTVSGKIYTDFTVRSTDGDNPDDGYGVDVKRFYFGANHKFDDTWQANITTDFHYNSSDGRTSLFVKKAYLQAKLNDMATLRVGSADLPWVPYVEGIYGLRFLENVLIDRSGFGTSADWGLHLLGKGGSFDYQISLVNGNGYKNPDRSNSMDFEGRLGFHASDNLIVALGVRSGKLGQDVEGGNTANTAKRTDLLVAWKGDSFTVGLDYFTADNFSKTAVLTGPEDSADGSSIFASFNTGGSGKFFVRVDSVNPSKDQASQMEDKYANIGYAFRATKGVDLAIAYKNDDSTNAAGTSTKSNEFGVWAQGAF